MVSSGWWMNILSNADHWSEEVSMVPSSDSRFQCLCHICFTGTLFCIYSHTKAPVIPAFMKLLTRNKGFSVMYEAV